MIAISAGHNLLEPGATFGNVTEHELARQWINAIYLELVARTNMANVYAVPGGTLPHKVAEINARPIKLAMELHFNSDPGHAGRGSETLYCPGSVKGEVAANLMQSALAVMCPPSRGSKPGWYRMDRPGHTDYAGDVEGDEKIDFFLKATHPIALIVEPEFIHNLGTIERIEVSACKVIANTLLAIHATL